MLFEVGLQETVRWYESRQAWWRRIKAGEYREYYHKTYKDLSSFSPQFH
jgi:dTDP-glucose 4,6-dehydratase